VHSLLSLQPTGPLSLLLLLPVSVPEPLSASVVGSPVIVPLAVALTLELPDSDSVPATSRQLASSATSCSPPHGE